MVGILQQHRLSLAVFLITLLGLGLRLYTIGAKTVWLDEAFSIWMAHHGPLELWDWLVRIDQHPPLYYMLLSAWQWLFGDLQGNVRMLSALCSSLAIPFFFGASRRFLNNTVGLLAAFILAISPFHVGFAQETRMYALLTLAAAVAFYFLARVLTEPGESRFGFHWIGLAAAQAAVMLTHNTAAVFFPLALNLGIVGWRWRHRHSPAWAPGVKQAHLLRHWRRAQGLAFLLWSPWALPFVHQSIGVARDFWILPPTLQTVSAAFRNFHFAHLPTWVPFFGGWGWIYAGLALLGIYRLRRRPGLVLLLLSLFLTPMVGELLVSLYRPIFHDRSLIWATLPYYLSIAAGIYTLRWRAASVVALALVVVLSATALHNYYVYVQKEDWATAARYVAERVEGDDVILFNATWVQLPFEYYFRHHDKIVARRGVPVDLFDRGVLEPKMTQADLPYLRSLVQAHRRVWLIYSHDWYTDPEQLIPRELDRLFQRADHQEFAGLQVIHYEGSRMRRE